MIQRLSRENLRIAVQNGGRLTARSSEILRGIGLEFEDHDRRLFARCRNMPVELLFVRDDDIPEYVQDGVADLGIVGQNVVRETDAEVRELEELPFGHCTLTLAVPADARASGPSHLAGARIASTHPRSTRRYLDERGLEARVIPIQGAAEIAPALDVADAVCDLVSTGTTMRMHDLRPVGEVWSSRAALVALFRHRRPVDARRLSRPGGPRRAVEERESRETRVRVAVDLDGRGRAEVETGIGFLDHMLEQLARHSLADLTVEARGDLEVDPHHTVEDVGIVLGRALSRALGQRRGIRRYGFVAAMDDARVQAALDLGGRSRVAFDVPFSGGRIGALPTELVEEFVRALARSLDATIHVACGAGRNDHHLAEATFKALARSLRAAAERDGRLAGELPTTKGLL